MRFSSPRNRRNLKWQFEESEWKKDDTEWDDRSTIECVCESVGNWPTLSLIDVGILANFSSIFWFLLQFLFFSWHFVNFIGISLLNALCFDVSFELFIIFVIHINVNVLYFKNYECKWMLAQSRRFAWQPHMNWVKDNKICSIAADDVINLIANCNLIRFLPHTKTKIHRSTSKKWQKFDWNESLPHFFTRHVCMLSEMMFVSLCCNKKARSSSRPPKIISGN